MQTKPRERGGPKERRWARRPKEGKLSGKGGGGKSKENNQKLSNYWAVFVRGFLCSLASREASGNLGFQKYAVERPTHMVCVLVCHEINKSFLLLHNISLVYSLLLPQTEGKIQVTCFLSPVIVCSAGAQLDSATLLQWPPASRYGNSSLEEPAGIKVQLNKATKYWRAAKWQQHHLLTGMRVINQHLRGTKQSEFLLFTTFKCTKEHPISFLAALSSLETFNPGTEFWGSPLTAQLWNKLDMQIVCLYITLIWMKKNRSGLEISWLAHTVCYLTTRNKFQAPPSRSQYTFELAAVRWNRSHSQVWAMHYKHSQHQSAELVKVPYRTSVWIFFPNCSLKQRQLWLGKNRYFAARNMHIYMGEEKTPLSTISKRG